MAKTVKNQFKTKKKKPFVTSPDFLYFSGTVFIVFLIYFFSLFRPWLPFDERLIYEEAFFPIPARFEEIFEIINSFILKAHMISVNVFFSNLITLRCNPLASAIIVFTSFFFQKNPFLYHLLQLSIHLINTALVYLILKKTFSILNTDKTNNNFILSGISLFTLLWALHSAGTEAILLTTNWTTILTYSFCLSFILYEISKIKKNIFPVSIKPSIIISILFLVLMFLTEYGYSLPLILFFIIFAYSIKNALSIKDSLISALKATLPYFCGLLLFVLISLLKPDSAINNLVSSQSTTYSLHKTSFMYAFIERNLWLVPQLFIHFLKLLVFPKTLSLYQSTLVNLSNSLISKYSIFCFLSYLTFLLAPLILFFIHRKKTYCFIYPLIYAFFFSIFPFLHIITPTYCLSADRYCYFPSFVLLFILIQVFYLLFYGKNQKLLKSLLISLSLFVLLMGVRTLIRISEWNDPYKLYSSAVKIEKNPLYRGRRLITLAEYVGEQGKQILMENLLSDSLNLSNKALQQLKSEKKRFPGQPITLKLYGLDRDSLIQKTVYSIANIKYDNYLEPPEKILSILDPYFENNLDIAAITPILLYYKVLLKAGHLEKAKKVIEFAYGKFNYSNDILNQLAEYYLLYEHDLDKSFKILQAAYNYYPNNTQILLKLRKYYEQKKDLMNEAKFAYLIGLREHSPSDYQIAVKLYLDLNQLQLANKSLRKLIRLSPNDPLTLLLTSRYLDLTGQRKKILGILNSALILSNKLGDKQDINVTKSILISLINVNASLGNISNAKQFLSVFEHIKDLTPQDKLQIQASKKFLYDQIIQNH